MAEERPSTEPAADAGAASPTNTPAADAGATGTDAPAAPSDSSAAPEPKWGGLSSRGRRITVRVIVTVATVLAVLGIFAVWANRQLLNPHNWSNTSTALLRRAEIRVAVSNYLVDQLYKNVDVEARLKSTLPSQLQPLAGPVSGALRNVAVDAAERLLSNSTVQEGWRQANRAADHTLVLIVNGGKGAVAVNGGRVTLDLKTALANLANQLGVPDISSKLPPNAAQLQILNAKQIKFVQDGGRALKGLALLLTILVPVLYALAIFLARGHRRETLMTVGLTIVLAGVLVLLGRRLLISGVTNSLVKNPANKEAAHSAVSIATSMLTEVAGAALVIGVVLALAAWVAGPAHWATAARRWAAPFMREHVAWTFGIVAIVMTLIFIWQPIPATGTPVGIIVFLILAFFGTEVLRRQTAHEFPER